MKVACARGCGFTLNITTEQIKEMAELGEDIVVAHEVCPTDADAPMKQYRVVTTVYEVQEGEDDDEDGRLAQMGDIVEASNFTMAVEPLGVALQAQWERIVGMAETIDDDADPQKESGNSA